MDRVNIRNTSNLEGSAEMSELSEKEEISGSVAQKHPRGPPKVQALCESYISAFFMTRMHAINENYFTGCLYRVKPPLLLVYCVNLSKWRPCLASCVKSN